MHADYIRINTIATVLYCFIWAQNIESQSNTYTKT